MILRYGMVRVTGGLNPSVLLLIVQALQTIAETQWATVHDVFCGICTLQIRILAQRTTNDFRSVVLTSRGYRIIIRKQRFRFNTTRLKNILSIQLSYLVQKLSVNRYFLKFRAKSVGRQCEIYLHRIISERSVILAKSMPSSDVPSPGSVRCLI